MARKAGLTIIGNYLEALERPLRMKGIVSDCLINRCSPLAMVGEYDPKYKQQNEDINIPMPTLLNIRKNLPAMLSRDENLFDQNYNLQPYAKNVRYKNESDYIIIYNTTAGYSHFVNGDTAYSDTYPANDFIAQIKEDKTFTKQSFPFNNSFNWKYFYDKFIDAVLREYDSDHIILLKINSAQWYMDSQEICAFEDKSAKFRARIEEIDEYFLERTHCLCIDDQYNFIPDKMNPCAFTYCSKNAEFYKRVVSDIEDIINGRKEEFHYNSFKYVTALGKLLYKKLSSDILEKNQQYLEEIDNRKLSYSDIGKSDKLLQAAFYREIFKLKEFLDVQNNRTLSDLVIELSDCGEKIDSKIDFDLLNLYTKYMKLNINDIIAVYKLYSLSDNKSYFRDAVKNIVENSDCLPIKAVKKARRRNIEFLNDYPYIHDDLKNVAETETFYIRIENNIYLCINLLKDDFMKTVDMKISKGFNHMKVISNGYVCPIELADALCSSYAFYIERAKRFEANRPVNIEFHTVNEFSDSLNIYDYSDLLVNENFVITLSEKRIDTSEFKAICDLSFLLKGNVKIGVMRSGFADQICHYMFAKKIEERYSTLLNSECSIYFDDTFYLYTQCFNGFEIPRFISDDISKKMLSNLMSEKLKNQINGNSRLPDLLFKNGLDETAVVSAEEKKLGEYKLCNKVLNHIGYNKSPASIIERKIDFNPVFYYTTIRPEVFMLDKHYDLSDHIVFPEFDGANKFIAEDMMSCDAVAIHMRLGDFVSLGYDVDNDFYIESIKKMLEIVEYTNKKYYVFSDNIPYVKEHSDEFGLNLVESDKITFIDHNKGENSFRDIQLMTYAKIMIASGSGVARTAFVLSKRCEQIYLWKKDVLELFEKIGRKNKHDIGDYSRSYRLDYSKLKPKALQ